MSGEKEKVTEQNAQGFIETGAVAAALGGFNFTTVPQWVIGRTTECGWGAAGCASGALGTLRNTMDPNECRLTK